MWYYVCSNSILYVISFIISMLINILTKKAIIISIALVYTI